MPQTYEVTAPNGKTLEITGDRVPTEAELRDIFKAAGVETGATTSAPAGVLDSIGHAVGDVVGGVRAGAASTVFHGGDLIRRGLGMERVINNPSVQASMRPPESVAGKVGYYGEQALEFAAPLARVSKAVAGTRLIPRMAAEAAASAGVAGVQSGGDSGQMSGAAVVGAALPVAGVMARPVVRAVQRAAAGAAEGGLGGAIASAVRTAAPVESKLLMTQALKPRATRTNFHGALDLAMPELKAAEGALGHPIQTIEDVLAAAKAAKANIQTQLNTLRGAQREIGAELELSPVADAMERSIPKKLVLENPEAAARLRETAGAYRGRFTLDEAETLLRETNAELDSFYSMYPHAQRSALMSNPASAALEAQAKALRDAIYTKLDAEGQGAAARELNRRYGSLMEIEGEAFRRSNVAKRQQPESLSEQIGAVRAAADMARGMWRATHGDLGGLADVAAAHAGRSTARAIKESQTSNMLITRAFRAFKDAPASVTMPSRRPVAGLLPQAAHVTPPPADASFVRGAPAEYARREVRGALPPARSVIEVPPGPDASFVRGVPGEYARRETRGALPPARVPYVTPVSAEGSVTATRAKSVVQRDPRTGRMRRVYLSE